MTNTPYDESDGYLKPMIYSSKSWIFAYRFIGQTKSFLKFEKVLCILNKETKNAMAYNLYIIDKETPLEIDDSTTRLIYTKFKDGNNYNLNPCGVRCPWQPNLPNTWEIFNYRKHSLEYKYPAGHNLDVDTEYIQSCHDASGQLYKPSNNSSNCDVFRKKLHKKGYNKFNNFGSVKIPQSESMFSYTSNKVREDGLLMDGSHKFYGDEYVNAREGFMYPNDYLKCKF